MKQRLKRIVLLAIVIVLAVLGVKQIIKGIQEAVAYYERHDKYVTVEGEVRNVYRFGLGYRDEMKIKRENYVKVLCKLSNAKHT